MASLHRSDMALTDQNGRVLHPAGLRGEPVPVNMFHASYQMAYPMILETVHATLTKGGKPTYDGVRMLMVTVDPERNSVTVLKKTISAHGADDRWRIAHTNASGTREVAALLSVQYRRLADGDPSHSNMILLLGAEGHINARASTLGAIDPKLVDVTRKLVATQR